MSSLGFLLMLAGGVLLWWSLGPPAHKAANTTPTTPNGGTGVI